MATGRVLLVDIYCLLLVRSAPHSDSWALVESGVDCLQFFLYITELGVENVHAICRK